MRVLLTGAGGQLGRSLLAGRPASFRIGWIPTDLDELDITDPAAIEWMLDHHTPNAVVNTAAYTAVDRAEDEPQQAYLVNAVGASNLASAAAKRQIPMVHISTDYVFPGLGTRPYREDDPTGSGTVYGQSKLAGEELVRAAGGRAVILRTSWLFSEFGHNFVRTMLRLGLEKEAVRVVNDQLGSPTYAGDLAAGVIRVLQEMASDPAWPSRPSTYHFCNEGTATWFDLAAEIMVTAGLECRVIPVSSAEYPQKAARPSYSVMDNSLFRDHFGFSIPHWKESLQHCLQHIC